MIFVFWEDSPGWREETWLEWIKTEAEASQELLSSFQMTSDGELENCHREGENQTDQKYLCKQNQQDLVVKSMWELRRWENASTRFNHPDSTDLPNPLKNPSRWATSPPFLVGG